MSKLELITRQNPGSFEEIAPDLADIYADAFRRPPWNENGRCPNDACPVGFTASDPGDDCASCGTALVDAYDKQKLAASWRTKLAQGAIMEVTRDDAGKIRRMTLVLAMTVADICRIKYADNPAMCEWLEADLPKWLGESPVAAWVDDTAGNRRDDPGAKGLYPSVERLQTLRTASNAYGYSDRCGPVIGATVLTRTKQPAIVATTKKAVPGALVLVGYEGCTAGFEPDGMVPDPRTLLVVPGWAIPEQA